MNAVMIIPTGIGCEIGGHAGDATPAARLLGSVCDKLILHPNVVNASDINEMPENALYVEGSVLDRFLEGKLELQEVKQNKILVVVNKPILAETINAVSATRATLGIDAKMVELNTPLKMIGKISTEGIAGGDVFGWKELLEQVSKYEFDALAIASLIEVKKSVSMYYYQNGGINPWGGVEAKASKLIANKLNKPIAHAPIQSEDDKESDKAGEWDFITDPRIASEIISKCYLHCVLKGLHKAPRIGKGLSIEDVDVMVSPVGCWGRPHYACIEAGIPIIVVKENTCVLNKEPTDDVIIVENYLEAAGVVSAMKAGITIESVRRPLKKTVINNEKT
ncbi:MAG TPA: DUF3326 domain-containing protein [bacterium]|nr:DUF3326 domain-containing protein [bacterium]